MHPHGCPLALVELRWLAARHGTTNTATLIPCRPAPDQSGRVEGHGNSETRSSGSLTPLLAGGLLFLLDRFLRKGRAPHMIVGPIPQPSLRSELCRALELQLADPMPSFWIVEPDGDVVTSRMTTPGYSRWQGLCHVDHDQCPDLIWHDVRLDPPGSLGSHPNGWRPQ